MLTNILSNLSPKINRSCQNATGTVFDKNYNNAQEQYHYHDYNLEKGVDNHEFIANKYSNNLSLNVSKSLIKNNRKVIPNLRIHTEYDKYTPEVLSAPAAMDDGTYFNSTHHQFPLKRSNSTGGPIEYNTLLSNTFSREGNWRHLPRPFAYTKKPLPSLTRTRSLIEHNLPSHNRQPRSQHYSNNRQESGYPAYVAEPEAVLDTNSTTHPESVSFHEEMLKKNNYERDFDDLELLKSQVAKSTIILKNLQSSGEYIENLIKERYQERNFSFSSEINTALKNLNLKLSNLEEKTSNNQIEKEILKKKNEKMKNDLKQVLDEIVKRLTNLEETVFGN
ncbi:hypothetical protein HK099_008215 [Clydaea vesicula]|uniref:Uncharacterized protein n=1 Tax=Clydaea vesicula TaxID=447962 RepID=A0AAD5TVI5_9FUNG|nr:hypothetical protein HK099_008215 [Clydaea vesicula]